MYYETKLICNMMLVIYLKFCLMCGRFIKISPPMLLLTTSESWPVVGLSPLVDSMGVFGMTLKHA